jgi:hypothetical protein
VERDLGMEVAGPDDPDDLWSLHWIDATGELYRMRVPKSQNVMPSRETESTQR